MAILFTSLQKHRINGLTAGAMKGWARLMPSNAS
jgi:hypothetical protein